MRPLADIILQIVRKLIVPEDSPYASATLPAPLITRLGLPLHVIQNRDLPDCIDGAVIISALEAAIAEMVPQFGLSPERDLLPGHVLRIVAIAAKTLFADPRHLRAAVYLTEQARENHRDSAALVHIRILALAKLGEGPLLAAEIDRLNALAPLDPALRDVLKGFDVKRHLAAAGEQRSQNHAVIWGEIPDDLSAHIQSLRRRDFSSPVPDKLVDFLFALRPEEEIDRLGFIHRLQWGTEAFYYMAFIARCALELREIVAKGGLLSDEENRILALFHQIPEVVCPPDLTILDEARASGRSIVIVAAHAGMAMMTRLNTMNLGLPISVIAQTLAPSIETDRFNIAAAGDDVQTRFLKLAKMLRHQQRLVLVLPDGPAGELIEVDLFGRPIKLGRGAAILAHHGRAASFFVRSQWNEAQFKLSLVPGPVATGNEPREAFEAEFHNFYLGCLRHIVLSAPEDMSVGGGFWRFLC